MSGHVETLKDMLSRVHLDLNEAKRHGKTHLVKLLTLQAAALTAAIAKLIEGQT